ncbi:Jacalin-like lectin domain, partial [Rhizoctonia solani]
MGNMILFTSSVLVWAGYAAAQASSGTFSVLSYNVAGLPELLSSGNPATNTPLLAPKLAPYGIVNVQEDFNYHAALYAGDKHVYRTATSGGVPFGSGLNTLSNYPFIDLQRVTWSKCAVGSGDCLTPKGFTLLRARLDTGVYVDIYNLHTDAGSESADITARNANIAQVISYINTNSAGNAVVVYGDTNARYTRAGDGIRQFASAGFTDAWLIRGSSGAPAEGSSALVCPDNGAGVTNACETVDKILYRSGPALSLTTTRFNNENSAFLNSTGYPLSDHYPITTAFTYSLSTSRRLTDLVGGSGGTWFSDLPSLPSGTPTLTSITLSGANRFDYISLTLSTGTTFKHGGTGGTPVTLTLNSGERITSLRVDTGSYNSDTRVFYVGIGTSSGRTLGAGTQTSSTVTWTAPSGLGLKGIYGKSGDGVDLLGGIWA